LFGASWATGLTAWLVAVASLLQLPFNAESNALTGWLRFNPFNEMLLPDKLTARGLIIRRLFFVAVGVSVSAVLAGFLVDGLAKLVSLAQL
jgi:hypothetical protein